ncbi:MAG: hypothetical protein HYU02_03670 [Thaumarchaeota archaeon]|nr:hypothetical protein [Nitrososphaerota archaeon]
MISTKMSRLWVVVVIAVVVVGGIVAFYLLQPTTPTQQVAQAPEPAPSAVSQVSDPKGDVRDSPPYLDIVAAKVVRLSDNQLSFEITVAGQIPKEPDGYLAYAWFLTSGITTLDRPAIGLAYDNKVGKWDAFILNSTGTRPERIRTVVSGLVHTISSDTAKVTVSADLLGDPTSFKWHVVSRSAPFAGGVPRVDKAPDAVDADWASK